MLRFTVTFHIGMIVERAGRNVVPASRPVQIIVAGKIPRDQFGKDDAHRASKRLIPFAGQRGRPRRPNTRAVKRIETVTSMVSVLNQMQNLPFS